MVRVEREDRIHEVMRRTMLNYEYIKANCRDNCPYEVTQLINSFSGAMSHPWEKMNADEQLDLRKLEIRQAKLSGWPAPKKELATDRKPSSYAQMLKWIRNAFAHGNIEFESDGIDICQVRL